MRSTKCTRENNDEFFKMMAMYGVGCSFYSFGVFGYYVSDPFKNTYYIGTPYSRAVMCINLASCVWLFIMVCYFVNIL